jgi:hypothetical protein
MEEALYTYLIAQSAISTLVGTSVYQGDAPQGKNPPYIICQTIGVEEFPNHDGTSNRAKTTIQIDAYHSNYSGTKALADAIRGELQGYPRGDMGGVFVTSCFKNGERDLTSPPKDGSENATYVRSQDYEIMHAISVPTF